MNDNVLKGWRHSDKWIYGTMLLSALISLFAAFVLSRDAVIWAGSKDAVLSCDLNSVISCSKVGNTWQAHFLGFPTSFLGLMFEPVVITVALAGLSGVKFKKLFMSVLQFVYFLALIVAYWLFTQSAFVIHALCPYCLLVTLGTTLVFFTLLHINIKENNFNLKDKWDNRLKFLIKINLDLLLSVLFISVIVVIIFVNYGAQLFS